MHTPRRSRDNQRTNRLMKHSQIDVHSSHYRCDAKQNLDPEGTMDSDRCCPGLTPDFTSQHDKKTDQNPRPPTVNEMHQERIVVDRSQQTKAIINTFREKMTIPQRP